MATKDVLQACYHNSEPILNYIKRDYRFFNVWVKKKTGFGR